MGRGWTPTRVAGELGPQSYVYHSMPPGQPPPLVRLATVLLWHGGHENTLSPAQQVYLRVIQNNRELREELARARQIRTSTPLLRGDQ